MSKLLVTSLLVFALFPALAEARGFIGVHVRKSYQDKVAVGLLVVEILPGGPADKAGLKKDDVIERIDDQPMKGSNALRLFTDLIASKGGKTITLHILRRGKAQQLTVMVP